MTVTMEFAAPKSPEEWESRINEIRELAMSNRVILHYDYQDPERQGPVEYTVKAYWRVD